MTDAIFPSRHEGFRVQLAPAFEDLFSRGYSEIQVRRMKDEWYDTHVQDPCCGAEVEEYCLGGAE